MKVDLSLVLSLLAVIVTITTALMVYLGNSRLRQSQYEEEFHRVRLDKTREALEADIKQIYDEIYRDKGRWEEINHLLIDSSKTSKFRTTDEQTQSAIDPKRFLSSFGLSEILLKIVPDQVFLLTPLSSEENRTTEAVTMACEKSGLRAIRGDEQNIAGSILPVVLREILRSRFVIANLNGRNPNVFYEMGIAQALGKDILMFAHRSSIEDLPFDIAQQQIIFYTSVRQLHERMISAIAQLGWQSSRSITENEAR